jgi:hypothetical protein
MRGIVLSSIAYNKRQVLRTSCSSKDGLVETLSAHSGPWWTAQRMAAKEPFADVTSGVAIGAG